MKITLPVGYILYVCLNSLRYEWNPGLKKAASAAVRENLPLLFLYYLDRSSLVFNKRHYTFLTEGILELAEKLGNKGIGFTEITDYDSADFSIITKKAREVFIDYPVLDEQKKCVEMVRQLQPEKLHIHNGFALFDPPELLDREAWTAAVLRRRITPLLPLRLDEQVSNLAGDPDRVPAWPEEFLKENPSRLIADANKIVQNNGDVPPSEYFKGGSNEADRFLQEFISTSLPRYNQNRNDPSLHIHSCLSPYLKYGFISPVYIAACVLSSSASEEAKEAFIEQLVIRRELSVNFCYYNKNYTSWDALPEWSRQSLVLHDNDQRPILYSIEELEQSRTDDIYWNAAMDELRITGFMHNYMRMYWGKQTLQWTKTSRQAFEYLLHLNNKYSLDGSDPNSYAGVAWIFGKHDRAFKERNIYGKVRYMNANGLIRKFNIQAYVNWVNTLKQPGYD